MSKIEVDYKCKKCGNLYPATINYTGKLEEVDLDDNQSRCPFCGEWNCADVGTVERAVKDLER
jgi:DNA-directed RNA polymerase subunit RPC12/RpoP